MLYLSRSRGLASPQPNAFEQKDSPSPSSFSPSLPVPDSPKLAPSYPFNPSRFNSVSFGNNGKFSAVEWKTRSFVDDKYRSRANSSPDTTSQEENSSSASASEYTSQEEEAEESELEQEGDEEESGVEEEEEKLEETKQETESKEDDEEEEDGTLTGEWAYILSPEEAMASRQLVEAQRHYKQLLQATVDLHIEELHKERFHDTHHVIVPEHARLREEELEIATLLASLQVRAEKENTLLQQQHREAVARGQRTKAQTCAVAAEHAATKAKTHADTAANALNRCHAAVERILQAKQRAEEKHNHEVKQQQPQPPSQQPPVSVKNEEKKEDVPSSDALQTANAILKLVEAAKYSEAGIDPRKINVAVNQISVQQDQVMKKVTQLKQILASAPTQEARNFGLKTLAQAICSQNITQVKAFSYAIVMFFVTLEYPFLKDVFLATLYEACGFCIPNYLNRANYKTMDDYKRALGFLEVPAEDNKPKGFEEEEKYFERMDGYIYLYAAYAQIDHVNHPHGIAHAWKWCANLLNTKPVFATASVLGAFLKVAGYQLQKKYPRQFKKMMQFIAEDFIGRLPEKNEAQKATKRRLQLFVEHDYFKKNCQLDMPDGREMPRVQASDLSRPQIEQDDDIRF